MRTASLIRDDFKGKLNEQADLYLDFILQSSGRMQELVKALATYSQIGKEKKLVSLNCNQVIQEVLADMSASIKKSNAQITVMDLPKLNGYSTELRLLFQNLISNALKFRKNGVIPEISISAKKQKGGWLFTVKDNGIGIDKKHQDKIFSIFKRLHNKDEYEGTGIGLAHCRKIVELHGGQLWVESEPGKGSTFYFTIPKL